MESIVSIWARIPGRPRTEIYHISECIVDRYKVYGQLRDQKGPHITIFSMKTESAALHKVTSRLKHILEQMSPFVVNIKDYDCFIEPNIVLYLKVKKTKSMSKIYGLLKDEFGALQTGYPRFNPHVTLAHDKLHKAIDGKRLRAAIKELKGSKFSTTFTAKELYISSHPKTKDRRRANLKIIRVRLKG